MKADGGVPATDDTTNESKAATISENETEAEGNVDSVEQIVQQSNEAEEVLQTDDVDSDNKEVGDEEEKMEAEASEDQIEEVDSIDKMENCDDKTETSNEGNEVEPGTDKTDEEDQEQIVDEEESQEENTSEAANESDEIAGVIENPLFEPEDSGQVPVEKFSVGDIGEDDLDFEPDIDETDKPPSWTDNVSSSKKVKEDGNGEEDDDLEVIDEVIISDTDDIDMLGDKIDAAFPGQKSKALDDDESDEERRCWRSEKSRDRDKDKSSGLRKTSPRKSRISGPRRSRFKINPI